MWGCKNERSKEKEGTRGVENHISTTVSYPYVWTVCGNVDFLWSLKKKERKKQHCHRSSGSDMVSGVGWHGVGRGG